MRKRASVSFCKVEFGICDTENKQQDRQTDITDMSTAESRKISCRWYQTIKNISNLSPAMYFHMSL